MKIPPSVSLFHFDFYEPLPIQVAMPDAPLTPDAGLLPLRQFDERIGGTRQGNAIMGGLTPNAERRLASGPGSG